LILLDTNIVSELIKVAPDTNVQKWYIENADNCCLSAITIAESAYGAAKLDAGKRKTKLQTQLTDWRIAYASRTYAFTAITAMIYGDIMSEAWRTGHNMSVPDAQIAAVAAEHDLVLATRNTKDFTVTALKLINPWAAT
jgi:toxin FitB